MPYADMNDATDEIVREAVAMTPSGGSLHVREIRNLDDFRALRSCWNGVVERSTRPVVYLTYEWMLAWWQCHQSREKCLLILEVSDGSEVVGIAPLVETRSRILGIRVTKIEFISMMRYAFSPLNCAASLDVIAVAERQTEVLESVFEHLRSRHAGWNFLRLHPIPEESPSIRTLKALCERNGLAMSTRMVFANACIDSTGDWDSYAAGRPAEFRKQRKALEKKLESLGRVELQECSSLQELDGGFDTLLEIERRSWKWEHGARLDAGVYREFYRRLAHEAGRKGWLRLWVLRVDGKPIAYDYSLEYAQSVESLKTSFDDAYRRYSPGNLLSWRAFERSFRRGVKRINLLWGDFPGKARWSPKEEQHYELFVFNDDLFSGLVRFCMDRLKGYRIMRFCSVNTRTALWRLGVNSF